MDIKKIVALSTLSQLGVMVVGLGLSLKDLRFFHLMTHALFKALLFLCVGVGIHTVFGTQDLRRFRHACSSLPVPSSLLSVANLALLGFPFLAGFYRKDSIIEGFYSASQSVGGLVAFLLGVGLTTAYSIKMIGLAVIGGTAHAPAILNGGGTPPRIKLPLLALGVASILAGFLLAPLLTSRVCAVAAADKGLPLVIIGLGGGLGWHLRYVKSSFLSRIWDLTPGYQSLADTGVGFRSVTLVDAGAGEMVSGPGWLSLFLVSQLSFYPVVTGGLVVALLLLL